MRCLLAATILVSCCASAVASDVAMSFRDASGSEYSTDNYVREIRERFPSARPLLFLVVTNKEDEPEFKKQMAALKGIDSETLQLLIVVGFATAERKSGYWLESENASALLEDGGDFKFLAIGENGKVCLSSRVSVVKSRLVTADGKLQPDLLHCRLGT